MSAPLPWRAKRIGDVASNRMGNIVDASGRIVCTFYGRLYDLRSSEEIDEIAAILALAPELLALAQEIAADNAAAGYGESPIASHRVDLALLDVMTAPRDLAGQSLAQMFDDMRHELARIAAALGRSADGTGFDCDWHDLAGDVETLAIEAPFKLPGRSPHGR